MNECALGASGVLRYDAAKADLTQTRLTLFNLEGDDVDACALTVTISPPAIVPIAFADLPNDEQSLNVDETNLQNLGNFPGIGPIAWPPLQLLLRWGVRGSSAEATVDVINGATINLTASCLRGQIQAARSEGITGTSAAYALRAFVGPAVPGRATRAQRTIYLGSVASLAESAVFPIPRFARSAYVIAEDAAVPPVVIVATLRCWQHNDGSGNVGDFVVADNKPPPFLIPATAQYVSVINQTGVSSRLAIVYDLLLS